METPDGEWYGLMFQDHGAVGRVPVLVPVTWQNDWPMLGVNGKGDSCVYVIVVDDRLQKTTNSIMIPTT